MMKFLAVVLLIVGNVGAFVVTTNSNNNRQAVTKISSTAELDGLVGVDIESGKKIVSTTKCIYIYICIILNMYTKVGI